MSYDMGQDVGEIESPFWFPPFVGLAYQRPTKGKDIVFILIIEHSSLRDFGP
jgi:hypothetical protein